MNIVEMLLDPGNPNRPGKSYTRRSGEVVTWRGVRGIISHRTGNDRPDADARAHYQYFSTGDRKASAHYFVDGKEVIRIIPEDEIAFHAGPANADTIGIELCEPAGDWQSGYPAYVELHADICLRYGLDPLRDIRGHFQIDPVNRPQDPIGLFRWEPFLQDVKNKLDDITRASGSPPKNEGNTIPLPDKLTPIMGLPVASAGQMRSLLLSRNPDAPDVVTLFLEIGRKYGVRGDIAFAQSCKETGFYKFGGDVKPEQHNPAGIGATGGVPGASFPSWVDGIEAQIQHLQAYATTDPLPDGATLYDPRYNLVKRGSAPYVEWLGAADNPQGAGWAWPGKGYGASVLEYLSRVLEQQTGNQDDDLQTRLAAAQSEIEVLKAKIAKAQEALA